MLANHLLKLTATGLLALTAAVASAQTPAPGNNPEGAATTAPKANATAPTGRKWSAEVNLLWPIFPGNLYSAKVLRTLYATRKTSGEAYAGLLHRPYEFRDKEGRFSNSALLFGYRQYVWNSRAASGPAASSRAASGLNVEWYNAVGPGRLENSVIDGRNYRSTDYEVGVLLGYTFRFNEQRKLPFYINLQPVGFSYVAFQSNPHPIVGQTGEKPIYFGAIQAGIQF